MEIDASAQCFHHTILLGVSHLGVERQQDAFILRTFRLRQSVPWRERGPGGFPMGTHDAAAAGNAIIKQGLHDRFLVAAGGQADAVALPIGSRPVWFAGRLNKIREEFAVAGGKNTPTGNHAGQAA